MIHVKQLDETLYSLLTILCDMLASEDVSYHEEIIIEFIGTIELEGKPLRDFIEIILEHYHLYTALSYTFAHMSYRALMNILEKMQIAWPEDSKMITRLQDVAYIIHFGGDDQSFRTRLCHESLIEHLLIDY